MTFLADQLAGVAADLDEAGGIVRINDKQAEARVGQQIATRCHIRASC